jgi:hypothetical protein
MAILTADCPHCRAKNMTFTVFGAMVTEKNRGAIMPMGSVGAACRACGLPIAAQYRANDAEMHDGVFEQRLKAALQSGADIDDAYVVRVRIWPEPAPLTIPEHLPDGVERAFLQAETNYSQPNCEEAAALMYRRALEMAFEAAYPTLSGSLAARIRELVASHRLPSTIGDWMTQVRLIGNDGAHESAGVSREDVAAARDFVDSSLRYIFTLPAQVSARRGEPTAVA